MPALLRPAGPQPSRASQPGCGVVRARRACADMFHAIRERGGHHAAAKSVRRTLRHACGLAAGCTATEAAALGAGGCPSAAATGRGGFAAAVIEGGGWTGGGG